MPHALPLSYPFNLENRVISNEGVWIRTRTLHALPVALDSTDDAGFQSRAIVSYLPYCHQHYVLERLPFRHPAYMPVVKIAGAGFEPARQLVFSLSLSLRLYSYIDHLIFPLQS